MDRITKDFIDRLSTELEDKATVISSQDFTEEREANMVVVGIEGVEQMNYRLPDFRHKVTIVVDSFIDEDPDGETFESICEAVEKCLEGVTSGTDSLDSFFNPENNVVGLLYDGRTDTILDGSHHAIYRYDVITSE